MSFTTPTKPTPAAGSIANALLRAPPQNENYEELPQPINMSVPWEKSLKKEKIAFVVPDVLSEDECNAIIQTCEVEGFEKALLNVGGGRQILAADVRNSGRVIIDDEMAAEILYERLKHVIPKKIPAGYNIEMECVGLNERFRVLKYDEKTDYFKPHRDGSFVRPIGYGGTKTSPGRPLDTSYFTLMLYLNTPKKGGGTNFVSVKGNIRRYNPVTGQALVFDHSIRHEGAPVESGVKYCIRTDIMYRRIEDAPIASAETVDVANHTNRCRLPGHTDHLWADCPNNPMSKCYNGVHFGCMQNQADSSNDNDDGADNQMRVDW